jgi:superoxide dismutase, Fe-Mn family
MFNLPDLPYDYEALEPTLSSKTMHFHHDKHHARYFSVVNEILGNKATGTLEHVVTKADKDGEKKLFNNAAQAWNHSFFWQSMSPKRAKPHGDLAHAIKAFGGLDVLKAKFVDEGFAHFGSGWVWLAADKLGNLQVIQTHDGDTLLTHKNLLPLLTCDLWEHAYYLDYQNDRKSFLGAWFDHLANWTFANHQFESLKDESTSWSHPVGS